MIRANHNDYRTPRGNFEPWEWFGIVRLAIAYQRNEYGYDWPDGVCPPPQPTKRMLFARSLRDQLIAEEHHA